ncbi:MAG: LPS-assembly protein LptD [Verrucomicrobiales bacterium]
MRRLPFLLLPLIAAIGAAVAQNDPFGFLERLGSDVKVDADDTTYDSEKAAVLWKGNVSIRLVDTEIYADKAVFDTKLEEVHVTGNVSIYRQGLLYRGEAATYNVRNNEINAQHLRSSFEPVFFTADHLKTQTDEISVVTTEGTIFTTDDNPDPDWFIKAKEVRIYPEDRIVFVSPTAYVGKVPVFWLPYLSQPLNADLGYQFTPGYTSQWGAFLLNRYGTLWGDHSIIQYNLDYRSARGPGGGINLLSRRWREKSDTFGKFQFYYAHDSDPQATGVTARTEDRADVDSSRYRINFQHRVYLPGPQESTLYVDFDINKLSDEFFYEDFFPGEFRLDPEPDNFITLTKQHERGEFNLFGRFRLNDFYQTDTRLPEIALDFTRQPIFDTGLFYWGSTSFGLYEEKPGGTRLRALNERIAQLEARQAGTVLIEQDGVLSPAVLSQDTTGTLPKTSLLFTPEDQTMLDDLRQQVAQRGFTRLSSYHEVLYPMTLGGAFNFTPKIGLGAVNYSSVDGPSPGSSTRGLFHAGFDASFKASKLYEDVKIPALGVDSLMHVVQPYLSYSFLGSNDLGTDFRRIDRLAPSTVLRPIDVPQFTAIDDLNSWNIVRLGVENRFLTRRGAASYPWLTTNTYFDTFIEDPEFDRDFSNLFNDIAWQPLPWLRLNIGSQVPIFGGPLDFTEVNTALTFMPIPSFEFQVGHRVLQDHPLFQDSHLIDLRTYTRLNDNWGLSTYHRYELDDSTFELQQYSLHRDLTSWTAALGVLVRDHRGEQEAGVVLSLTLKDFPSVSIPLDLDASGGGAN